MKNLTPRSLVLSVFFLLLLAVPVYWLVIGRQTRPALYRLSFSPRWSLAPDELRFEVTERVASDGTVLTPLALDDVEAALDQVVAAGAESLAVEIAHPEAPRHVHDLEE